MRREGWVSEEGDVVISYWRGKVRLFGGEW